MTKYCLHRQHYRVTEIAKIRLYSFKRTIVCCLVSNYGTMTAFQFHVLIEFLFFVLCLLHNETGKAKPGDVQSFCCDAYSLPAAHSQHQQNMR